MSFRRILVALDSDSSSSSALAYAASLAKELGAELLVLHVWAAPAHTLGTRALISGEELLGSSLEGAQRDLEARLEQARAIVPGVRGVLRRGEAAAELLAEIAAAEPDLVVMGSHGRGGISRAVLGSVAAEIVRASPVPVLIVGPGHTPPKPAA